MNKVKRDDANLWWNYTLWDRDSTWLLYTIKRNGSYTSGARVEANYIKQVAARSVNTGYYMRIL
jgi:hypothetical protein